jgi:ribonuclease HI
MMEAAACRDGMILAREMNFRRVQVETDTQELVKLLGDGRTLKIKHFTN